MPLSPTSDARWERSAHCGVPARGCRRFGDGSCSCACCDDPREPTHEVSQTSFDRASAAQKHASETGEPEAWSVAGDAWEEHGDEVSASFCRGMAGYGSSTSTSTKPSEQSCAVCRGLGVLQNAQTRYEEAPDLGCTACGGSGSALFVKRCACGLAYTHTTWAQLRFREHHSSSAQRQVDPHRFDANAVEDRDCTCGAVLSIVVRS